MTHPQERGSTPQAPIAGRIQLSGALILLGLLAELASLHWSHPISFLAFLALGGLFILGGMLLFLFSLVSKEGPPL
jgi:hypothetical protein